MNSFKVRILIVMLFLGIFMMPAFSIAEECENALKRCEPIKDKDKEKYKKCVDILCAKEKAAKKEEETKKTCEIGLRKCNALREEYEYYWNCMDDTCTNPPEEKSQDCEKGRKQCEPRLNEYRVCVNLICKNPKGDVTECQGSQDVCADSLRRYWDCSSKVCLGDVSQYRIQKQVIPKPSKGKKVTTGITSAKEGFTYPPAGVPLKEWVSSLPPEQRIRKGDVEKQLSCKSKFASLRCSSRDLKSCLCSDGSSPVFLKNK